MLKRLETEPTRNPIEETANYNPCKRVALASGHKVWFEDDSKPYIDLIMGYSSANFGHANPNIQNFVIEAASLYDNVVAFTSTSRDHLDHQLITCLEPGPNRLVYYPVGGSKTVDAAVKLARAHTKKSGIISFKGGFHGYSFGAMLSTDEHFVNKKQFKPLPGESISFPFPDRKSTQSKLDASSALSSLNDYLKSHQEDTAAVIFEPIQGAAGFISPPDGFLKDLISLINRYRVVSICDEIQTAVYRTGTFYNHTQSQLQPDIVLVGKSLAGGYYPLGALIATQNLFESIDLSAPGFDSTFSGNLFGIHIANRTLEYAQKISLEKTVKSNGDIMLHILNKLGHFPVVSSIDGNGMALRFKLGYDNQDPQKNKGLAQKVRERAFNNHLIIQTAGTKGDYIKLSPCFFMSVDEFEEAISMLNKSIQEAI